MSRQRASRSRKRSSKPSWARVIIAAIIDGLDLTVGQMFGVGPLVNVACTWAALMMFRWRGLATLWEWLDVTQTVGAFVPTLTILALLERRR